ncbi:copper transporter family protein [Aspergillus aculeatinus CBS 121060]
MDMHMSSSSNSSACSVTMLWNWTTIDACFLSSTWHITTAGQFAVSCIGVAFLVVVLDVLRLLSKQYEEHLQRQFQRQVAAQSPAERTQFFCGDTLADGPLVVTFRASPVQQLIRALLQTLQFGLAYIIMLNAMSYNGYMIISIFLGAFVGKVLCDRGEYRVVLPARAKLAAEAAPVVPDKPEEWTTGCCG